MKVHNLNTLKGISGIYEICCLSNDKKYIGSACDLRRRYYEHLSDLRLGKHSNIYLQRTFQKYGEDNLQYNTLMFCSKIELIDYEQKYIDNEKGLINICPIAGNSLGIHLSEETKRKISQAHKGKKLSLEHRERIALAGIGRKQSLEERRKRALSITGRIVSEETRMKHRQNNLGKIMSEETKEKIRLSLKKRFNPFTDEAT